MEGIYTVEEIQTRAIPFNQIDGVTCATFAVISTPALIYEFRFAESGKYRKAIKVSIDGEDTTVGPAPNETLGLVDGIVSRPAFIQKLVEGGKVKTVVTAEKLNGKREVLELNLSLKDFDYAKLFFTRVCVKNYMGFISYEPVKTIFAADTLNPGEFTFSGCGALNPHEHFSIKPGEKIFIAGTTGTVTGEGTRSKPEKPNIAVLCDLKEVKKEYFGIFNTGGGVEYYLGLGIKRKITEEEYKKIVNKTPDNITLPVANVIGRDVICKKSYKDVWKFDESFNFRKEKCENCSPCLVEEFCPANAFRKEEGFLPHCMFCGRCLLKCPHKAIEGNTGTININGKTYNITFRQSSLKRAREIATMLKTFDKIGLT